MKLYKDNNVNIVGGCIFLILLLFILMVFYWVFMGIYGVSGVLFLWIKDLFLLDLYYILVIIVVLLIYVLLYLMIKVILS